MTPNCRCFLQILRLPDTARMARLAAVDRIRELAMTPTSASAVREHLTELETLAKDADRPVASAVARVIELITGKTPSPPMRTPTSPTFASNARVLMRMVAGDQVILELDGDEAPETAAKFLSRAQDQNDEFRGTAFHRLLPNALIQGGSRDGTDWSATPCETDIKRASASQVFVRHVRSGATSSIHFAMNVARWPWPRTAQTRGSASFFVDLVDEPAFNHHYTVLAA